MDENNQSYSQAVLFFYDTALAKYRPNEHKDKKDKDRKAFRDAIVEVELKNTLQEE
jgi:hypothetical protein